jgi:hypothetical protein
VSIKSNRLPVKVEHFPCGTITNKGVTFCLIAYPIVCHIEICVSVKHERLQTFDCTNEGRIFDERNIHFVVVVSDESGHCVSFVHTSMMAQNRGQWGKWWTVRRLSLFFTQTLESFLMSHSTFLRNLASSDVVFEVVIICPLLFTQMLCFLLRARR